MKNENKKDQEELNETSGHKAAHEKLEDKHNTLKAKRTNKAPSKARTTKKAWTGENTNN